jgi:hypothetical protein
VEPHTDESQRHLAQFAMGLAIVNDDECGIPLELPGCSKIDFVASPICGPLRLVPFVQNDGLIQYFIVDTK